MTPTSNPARSLPGEPAQQPWEGWDGAAAPAREAPGVRGGGGKEEKGRSAYRRPAGKKELLGRLQASPSRAVDLRLGLAQAAQARWGDSLPAAGSGPGPEEAFLARKARWV